MTRFANKGNIIYAIAANLSLRARNQKTGVNGAGASPGGPRIVFVNT